MKDTVDVAVVGAGIVGLAFALEAARRGRRVAVFERDAKAQGASIRNFGMVWPIGQPPGDLYRTAMLSRETWLGLGAEGALWVNRCGSLHAVYEEDEAQVLREFASLAAGIECEYVDADDVKNRFPSIKQTGLRGALYSPTELVVDPRQTVANLPDYLQRKYHVTFHFNTAVTQVEENRLVTASGHVVKASQIIIASGADFQTLFPELHSRLALKRCKLQMMRTAPQPRGWSLGPHLAGGLTLTHYKSFEICPTLPALKARIQRDMPEYVKLGIHVMASQNELGEVIIGDSHEYDADIGIFDSPHIDDLILKYLRRMVDLPDPAIASRWHGLYAKHPSKAVVIESPLKNVTYIASPGGAGMTLSFGIAKQWWDTQ